MFACVHVYMSIKWVNYSVGKGKKEKNSRWCTRETLSLHEMRVIKLFEGKMVGLSLRNSVCLGVFAHIPLCSCLSFLLLRLYFSLD